MVMTTCWYLAGVTFPSKKLKIHSSDYNSSWGEQECLNQIWQSIQKLSKPTTKKEKYQPHGGGKGENQGISKVSRLYPAGTVNTDEIFQSGPSGGPTDVANVSCFAWFAHHRACLHFYRQCFIETDKQMYRDGAQEVQKTIAMVWQAVHHSRFVM